MALAPDRLQRRDVHPWVATGGSEETADTGDVPAELVDESIAADEVAPDEPGPGDSEGEAPVAPNPEPTE